VRSVITRVLAASLAAVLGGCGPAPAPRPSPTPDLERLRPLTSRDDPAPSFAPSIEPLPPGHPPVDGGGPAPLVAGAELAAGSVSGTVRLAPRLMSQRAPSDVLYIIARNHETNTVVAVRREEKVRFPHAFELSAKDAMVEGTPFTGPFDLTARLSRTGDAIAGTGDVEGITPGVAAGARGVSITLDRVRP
jgi:cytochrome c-type biogenesis protein CcmH